MAAKTTWVALLPRYTSFLGAHTFEMDPVHVVDYDSVELEAWRGEMDSDATFKIELEESIDKESWDQIAVSSPPEDTETSVPANLSKPWLRVVVTLTTTGTVIPAVTCWLVGALVRRLS